MTMAPSHICVRCDFNKIEIVVLLVYALLLPHCVLHYGSISFTTRHERGRHLFIKYRFMMNESQDTSASCISPNNHKNNEEVYLRCLDLLKSEGVKVVAFDMDQTAVSMHSRRRLRRGDPFDDFLGIVSKDFRNLVPLLHEHGFGLSIATHSDESSGA
jgi:hypothetical protein